MRCPICRRPTTWKGNSWRPFCSERCQMIDLGTWATEHYRISGPSLTTEWTILESSESQNGTDSPQPSA
ncbi:MAG: DNA gyrase inhibitor YacG [Nitrospira sp.]|nr:DNA gyrase inhibitor YacG [Nitrospira sp.]